MFADGIKLCRAVKTKAYCKELKKGVVTLVA